MKALALASKDLRLLLRDRTALLFNLAVPMLVISIVAVSLGGGGAGLVLPVVNEDEGPVAEALLETLRGHVMIEEVDRAEARRRVAHDNEAAAALVLPERLSKQYLGSRPTNLPLWTDPAKGTEVDVIKAYLLLAEREAATLADPLFSENLILVEEENLTGTRLTTTSFEQNVPGFSIMFVLMGVLFGVAFGLRDEIDQATAERLLVAPASYGEILGGKLLVRFGVGVVQMLLLFGFGRVAFDVSLGPSLMTFGVLTLVVVFAMVGFSLFVTSFARTREQIIPLGLTVVMLTCGIGGCWWPLFQEPPWLQSIARLTVTAWAMEGVQDLVLRDRGLAEILPVIAVLLLYGTACFGVGAYREQPNR